jgi:hypothetical protein
MAKKSKQVEDLIDALYYAWENTHMRMVLKEKIHKWCDDLQEFHHDNVRGENVYEGHDPSHRVLYSYREPICVVYNHNGGFLVWITQEKFSVTTSRHTSYVRVGWHFSKHSANLRFIKGDMPRSYAEALARADKDAEEGVEHVS